MSFKDDMPDLQNLIKNDIPDMKGNNEELKSSGGAEVIGFDDADFFESTGTIQSALEALSPAGIVDDNLDDDDPSNGYYYRLECGLQVCWSPIFSIDIDKTYGDLYRSGTKYFNMPANFTNSDYVVLVETTSTVNAWGAGNSLDSDEAQIVGYSYESRTGEELQGFIIGRWK